MNNCVYYYYFLLKIYININYQALSDVVFG